MAVRLYFDLSHIHTVPHELAHGAFNLRHTFSAESQYQLGEGTTDNLMDYGQPQGTGLWKYQWDLIHDPEGVLFAWTEEVEEGAYKYWISDDYVQNKKVEIAYWKWQDDGAPELTMEEVEERYFSISMNDYQKKLFHGISTDIANLKSRDKKSAEMFKILVEEGNIDAETLTALIKERHALTEYHRTVVPLLATGDILMKYCAILSVFSGPASLPPMGKVGTYIADLSGVKAANLASKITVTFAELQPGQWLMQTGKLFMQGALVDASIQTGVNMIIADDFETAIEEIDFADVAVTGAINAVTGGGVSLRKLFGARNRIGVVKGTTVVTLELSSASVDWKSLNSSEQYVSLFNGDKDLQRFFCDFIIGISNNVLPEEMLEIFKKWSKSDFDVRWYSTLSSSEKTIVRKIYDIIHSSAFKEALKTNSTFVKMFLQNIINHSGMKMKTIEVKEYEYLPEDFIMPEENDNTNVVIPETNGY